MAFVFFCAGFLVAVAIFLLARALLSAVVVVADFAVVLFTGVFFCLGVAAGLRPRAGVDFVFSLSVVASLLAFALF